MMAPSIRAAAARTSARVTSGAVATPSVARARRGKVAVLRGSSAWPAPPLPGRPGGGVPPQGVSTLIAPRENARGAGLQGRVTPPGASALWRPALYAQSPRSATVLAAPRQ